MKIEFSQYQTFRTLPFRLPTISDKSEMALGKGKNTLTKTYVNDVKGIVK